MMTPYEKLKSLPDAAQYLKPNNTFKKMDDMIKKIRIMNPLTNSIRQGQDFLTRLTNSQGTPDPSVTALNELE